MSDSERPKVQFLACFLLAAAPILLVGCQQYRVVPPELGIPTVTVDSNTVPISGTVNVTAFSSVKVYENFPPPTQTYVNSTGICVYTGELKYSDVASGDCVTQNQLPIGVEFSDESHFSTAVAATAAPGEVTRFKHQASLKFTLPGKYTVFGYEYTYGNLGNNNSKFGDSKSPQPQVITVK